MKNMAQNDKEFKQIPNRFIRQIEIPVHNRNFEWSTAKFLELVYFVGFTYSGPKVENFFI